MNEEEQSSCIVCSDDILPKDQGSLQTCPHIFHFECLVKWGQVSNTCPCCRAPFICIKLFDGTWIPITEPKKKEEHEEEEEEEEVLVGDFDFCYVCGKDYGERLICDGEDCNRVCHVPCARLESLPDEDEKWYCTSCLSKLHNSVSKEEEDIEAAYEAMELIQSSSKVPKVTLTDSQISQLFRKLQASTKNDQARFRLLKDFCILLEQNRTNSDQIVKLLEKGLLIHLRGWIELSLHAGNSMHEKEFRKTLLQQIDQIKLYVSAKHLKESRINRVLLEYATHVEDKETFRSLAFNLLEKFVNIISGAKTAAATTTTTAAPATTTSSSVGGLKRARFRG